MYAMTIWYNPQHSEWYDQGITESMKMIKNAGFTHVNWNPDAGSSYIYSSSEMDHIRLQINQAGLKSCSLHAAHGIHNVMEITSHALDHRKDFTSSVEWRRLAGMDLIINRLELANKIGSNNVVLHVSLPEDFQNSVVRDALLDNIFRSFDGLLPQAEKMGLRIAVENLQDRTIDTQVLFDALFERYSADYIGWCFDSGHAHTSNNKDLSFLEPYLDRMIATHLHDNYGVRDDHLIPGDAGIDWDIVVDMIARSTYQMPLNYETPWWIYSNNQPLFYESAFRSIKELTGKVIRLRDADREDSKK